MKVTEEIISKDLKNPDCDGFYLEVENRSILARRKNRWQWDVTFENPNGREYTETLDFYQIMDRAKDMLNAENCEYVPHIPTAAFWNEEKINKFINSLCPQMCKSCFVGFTLTADGAETYTVLHHPSNALVWYVDGKQTDFSGVLHKTKAKLSEKKQWEYKPM